MQIIEEKQTVWEGADLFAPRIDTDEKPLFWQMKDCHGHGVHTCYSVSFPLWTPSRQQSCSEQKTPPHSFVHCRVFSTRINPISTFRVIISSQVSFNTSTWQVFKTPCHVLESQNPSCDVKGWSIYFSTKRNQNNSDSNDHFDGLKCLGAATEHMSHTHTHTRYSPDPTPCYRLCFSSSDKDPQQTVFHLQKHNVNKWLIASNNECKEPLFCVESLPHVKI